MQADAIAPKGDRDSPLLAIVLDSLPHGLSIWGEDKHLVLYNRRYLDLYCFPPERVRPGLSLREICALTVELGNHDDMDADALHELYQQRFDDAANSGAVLQVQKPIRGRVVKTSYVRSPGLGWIVTHEDVTAEVEKQWMAELREKTLAAQNMRFDAAISNMPHGLSMYDAEWRLLICNERYRQIYDMPPELTRTGTPFKKILAHREASGTVALEAADDVQHVLDATGQHAEVTRVYRLDNGRIISVQQAEMAGGGYVVTHQDVTRDIERLDAVRANETLLANQNMRFEAAINNMRQGLCMFDRHERLVICNTPYATMYSLPVSLMVPGTTLTQILEFRFQHGAMPKQGREAYVSSRRVLVANRSAVREDVELEDGRIISCQHQPMADGGWVATHEDITEQRQIEARVRHLARHDALTDLPNRVLLREEMDKLEARIQRQEMVAVLCLDLDHFKAVNDTLGHGIGDQVLVTVAQRLREASRETDVVARLGGDEFAILVHSLDSPSDAAVIAARIVRSLTQPMQIDGHQVLIGTSIGIAVAPIDGQDAETLLRNADIALYRAKSVGRGDFHFFEKGMDEALHHRRALEQGLRVALSRNEFRLVYQPLMNLVDNRVCCFEALLRWDHPEHGLVPPVEFIPVAEETGVINAIGDWVLREACRTAAAWPEHVRLAVNLSAGQFKNRDLVDQVMAALAEGGLAPNRLELEITENLLLVETELTMQTLHRLRALGVRISMDDFGTGYSSLSYLRAFPFDKIKIDRSFISGLRGGEDSMAIIKAVIGLGQSLGMSTTAEGIETEEQLAAVRAQGCSEVQGFLFSPPLPASGVAALLGTLTGPQQRNRRRG
jgi:diguanylate cyclase (GGDEF)-like protein